MSKLHGDRKLIVRELKKEATLKDLWRDNYNERMLHARIELGGKLYTGYLTLLEVKR